MKWSYSAGRTFALCPRRWYFRYILASRRSKKLQSTEALRLRKLRSVSAWRGSLVDEVLSRYVTPRLNRGATVDEAAALGYLKEVASHRSGPPSLAEWGDLSPSNVGPEIDPYLFLEREYGGALTKSIIAQALEEARLALRNILSSDLIGNSSSAPSYFIAQRTLFFKLESFSIFSTPDLIVFSRGKNPLIVDWKVEAAQNRHHWLQLGVYALALSRVNPHKDFPKDYQLGSIDPTQIRLLEYQLLHNEQHEYELAQPDVLEIEDHIYRSALQLSAMLGGHQPEELRESDFPRTQWPHLCLGCEFRKICWEGQSKWS